MLTHDCLLFLAADDVARCLIGNLPPGVECVVRVCFLTVHSTSHCILHFTPHCSPYGLHFIEHTYLFCVFVPFWHYVETTDYLCCWIIIGGRQNPICIAYQCCSPLHSCWNPQSIIIPVPHVPAHLHTINFLYLLGNSRVTATSNSTFASGTLWTYHWLRS